MRPERLFEKRAHEEKGVSGNPMKPATLIFSNRMGLAMSGVTVPGA
jgi:hypothetical protein